MSLENLENLRTANLNSKLTGFTKYKKSVSHLFGIVLIHALFCYLDQFKSK